MNLLKLLSLLFLCTVVFSCNNDDDTEPVQTEFLGPKVSVGNGQAWTYVKTNDQQEPISLGIRFDESALQGLPTGSMFSDEFQLALPTDLAVAPYDHVTLDWNEHGHEPEGVYNSPHFDAHFYFMSVSERDLIGPFDSVAFNKPLPAEYLAPNYLETPGGVPRMGAHIINLQSPEIAGTGPFTHTFIYGKYDAKVNFLEPMVTKAFLDGKTDIMQAISQPEQWQQSGFYPGQYSIKYDADTQTYSISLEGLTKK